MSVLVDYSLLSIGICNYSTNFHHIRRFLQFNTRHKPSSVKSYLIKYGSDLGTSATLLRNVHFANHLYFLPFNTSVEWPLFQSALSHTVDKLRVYSCLSARSNDFTITLRFHFENRHAVAAQTIITPMYLL